MVRVFCVEGPGLAPDREADPAVAGPQLWNEGMDVGSGLSFDEVSGIPPDSSTPFHPAFAHMELRSE